jgi:hypothetical protein
MNLTRLSAVFGMCLMLFARPVSAQSATQPNAPVGTAAASSDKAAAKVEAARIREGRRLQARSLLFSLSGEARRFRDQTLRARSLARIADALWGVDAEQGRALFREAWEAAEKGDQESQTHPRLRREVLSLAARHDRVLAEEFLQKLKTNQQQTNSGAAGNTSPSGNSLWALPEALEKRLGLAKDLLNTGDVERALQFADPVLGNVTISTVEFLTQLREKDPEAADRRYAGMLENTRVNLLADANTISLLSSYIFTPHLYVTFDASGSASSSMMRVSFPAASIAQQQRLAFFQTARGVFLRPQPPPDQDRSTTGIAGKYMALKRLLPLFEQYAPPEITQGVRALFESLGSQLSDGVRQGEDEWVQKGINPEKPFVDQEHSLLDDVEHTRTSDERDQLYFRLALLALGNDEVKARDYADKIDRTSFRERTQAWVDWHLAAGAVEKKKVEKTLEIARRGELTHIQRVWVFTQSAKLLAASERDKSLSLLDEARAEARLLDRADVDRPRALLAVAGALRLVEPTRVPDAISDAVEAANWAEDFTGEDGVITLTVNDESEILRKTEAVPDFDVRGIFGEMTNLDFERAVQLAGGFKGEAAHANAVIAIAQAMLNDKPHAHPAKQPPKTN